MIEIRKMTLEDFDNIKQNLQDEFDEFWNSSILKSELESENSYYITAIENGSIVGFAGILITPDCTEITNIVTKKSERKKGIGRILLEKLIEISKGLGKTQITLEVNENNSPAISLYESFQFERVGLRKKYYNKENDAIIMTKNI